MPYTDHVKIAKLRKAFKVIFWTSITGLLSCMGFLAFTHRFHEMKLGWRILMTAVLLIPTGLLFAIPLAIVIMMILSFWNILGTNYQMAKVERENRKKAKAKTNSTD
jgi:hypothetical protein